MVLAVYSRVGGHVYAAGVDLEDLPDLIAARYGLTVDGRALAALAQDGRVQRTDIEPLEALALILRVRVDDLLDVRTVAPAAPISVDSDDVLLDPEHDARLRELLRCVTGVIVLSPKAEAYELETLIAEAGCALVERDFKDTAQRLGVPLEVARTHINTQAADAARFCVTVVADPQRMAAEVEAAKAQRRVRHGYWCPHRIRTPCVAVSPRSTAWPAKSPQIPSYGTSCANAPPMPASIVSCPPMASSRSSTPSRSSAGRTT